MDLEAEPKFEHRSLPDQLVDEILRLIEADDLVPGDRLPSVKALADRFSVGAPTVRETLKKLELTGLIEVRHGSGTYLRNSVGRLVMSNPYTTEVRRESIMDLLEARLHIEPILAGLAATRAGDDDLSRMAALLDRAAMYLGGRPGDDERLNRTNMEFHIVIARSTRNDVFSQMLLSLVEVHLREQLTVQVLNDDRHGDHLEHVAIFEAIRDRDEERARALMHAHLAGVRNAVQLRLDQDPSKDKEP